MESHQRDHIINHLPELVEITNCNAILLLRLRAAGILAKSDVDIINTQYGVKRSKQFYDIIQTRTNAYDQLIMALEETMQSGAASILKATKWTDKAQASSHVQLYSKKGVFENAEPIFYIGEYIGHGSFNTKLHNGNYNGQTVYIKKFPCLFQSEQTIIKEMNAVTKIGKHENLLTYLYGKMFGEQMLLLAMEICDTNLRQYLKKPPVSLRPLYIFKKIANGLRFLHYKNGMTHGNLKPENILIIHSTLTVKLSDFGTPIIRSELVKSFLESGIHYGVVDWMAPEIIVAFQKKEYPVIPTFKSDVFSLGCIFCFALSNGFHPFGNVLTRASNILEVSPILSESTNAILKNESTGMLSSMISRDESNRPAIEEIIDNESLISLR